MNLASEICREASGLLDSAMVKIQHCLAQLSDEQVWWRPFEEANSIGNLLLHISGNLRQWGIVPLNGDTDLRRREHEFEFRGPMTKEQLLTNLTQTVLDAKAQFLKLDESRLLSKTEIQGFRVTLLGAIAHTTSHFVGHVQQIILLTRLQLGNKYRFEWTVDGGRDTVPV